MEYEVLATKDLVQISRVATALIGRRIPLRYSIAPSGAGFLLVESEFEPEASATVLQDKARCHDCGAGPCVGPAMELCRKSNSRGTLKIRGMADAL